jgi:GntR family transcriptional regulator, rspAB operon transcriptional repressor
MTLPTDSERSVTRQAEDMLRRVILEGHLQPGQRLNELELSSSLGISRSPIREALQRLAKEGLVQLIANRGAFVSVFDPAQVEELYEVREALECRAASLATERATPEDLAAMRQVLAVTRIALGGPQPHYPPTQDFHALLVRAAHNSQLARLAGAIDAQLRVARGRSGYVPGRAKAAYQEHLAVYEAIAARDAEAAPRLIRAHLAASKENLRERVVGSDQARSVNEG